jgi:preprotein translocase subunit SecE
MIADKVKFALALLLLIAGIAGFYVLGEQPMVLRVLSVLFGLGAGAAVAWFTAPGQRFFVFGQESAGEVKKVSWPTRKETMQTTGIIFAFVLVMAVFLYLADKTVEWTIFDLVLGWKRS